VVSRQDLDFSWRGSERLKGSLVDGVSALKAEPGDTDIAMSGSVSVVRQLLAVGLLDELHLLVHPIAVRKGERLFEEAADPLPLRLASSQTLSTGVLYLVYTPDRSAPEGTYEDAKADQPQSETA
jgi:dihydrofolate reductase